MAVEMHLKGGWLIVKNAQEYFDELAGLASYTYRKFVRSGWPTKTTVQPLLRRCYAIQTNGSGKKEFWCRSGLSSRIAQFFQEKHIAYTVHDDFSLDQDAYYVDREFLSTVTYRDYQEECVNTILNSRGGLIKAATGLGKTYIISVLARAWPRAKIDIITRSREVVQSIARECRKFGVDPAIICSGRSEIGRVSIYTAASLHKSNFDADIVLADECHELVTPKTLDYLYRYSLSRMFGFSATIDTRADNAHFHLFEIFGDIIFNVNYQDAQSKQLVVPILVQWVPVTGDAGLGMVQDMVMLKRSGIWCNTRRNQIIAREAMKHLQDNRQVLILVETVTHAVQLKQLLPNFSVCVADVDVNNFSLRHYSGDALKEVMQSVKYRDKYRDMFQTRKIMGIIATGIWSAGVSFDDLEVLIRADARVSKTVNIQAPGRVCRIPKSVDKSYGLVVDFIDAFDPRFLRRSKTRFQHYKELGWEQCDQDWNPIKRLNVIS